MSKMQQLKKWKILEEVDVSPNAYFPVFKQKIELGTGKIIDDYFISKPKNGAMILAISPDKKIFFIRQFRLGVGDIATELPAGTIKENSNALQTAKEELLEEAGVSARDFKTLGEIFLWSPKTTMKIEGFLAIDATITDKQKLDVTEDIEVFTMSLKEAQEKIISGEIKCSETISIISMAALKYPNLF